MKAALVLAASVVTAAVLASDVEAHRSLPFIGVTDNEIGDTTWGNEQARRLGIRAVRVFVWYYGSDRPRREDIQLVTNAMDTRARVFVTVTQPFRDRSAPTTAAERIRYAHFVKRLARATGARDFMVWNEPNNEGFWGGRVNPRAYARLLARAYDALTPMSVRVWAFNTDRSSQTRAFVREVGRWYRSSGRQRPLFYGASHHPYPVPGEPWNARHPGTSLYTIGDTGRLLTLLSRTFQGTAQCLDVCSFPIVYGEIGWATAPMSGVPVVTTAEQARNLSSARRFLARYPRVRGLFNFELRDSAGWPTGLFDETGRAKDSVHVLFRRVPLAAPGDPIPIIQ